MKKLKLLVVGLIASVFFVPTVFADDLGTVTEYRPADSVKQGNVNIDQPNGEVVTATYSGVTELQMQDVDGGAQRNYEAAWFGFRVDAPSGVSGSAKIRRPKVQSDTIGVDGDYRVWNWTDAKENAGNYVYVYTSVTKEDLEAAAAIKNGVVTKTWQFDWDGDSRYEQTLNVVLEPASVTLKPKDGVGESLFTPDEYQTIQSSIKENVTITFDFMGETSEVSLEKGTMLSDEQIAQLYSIDLEKLGLKGYKLDNYYKDADYKELFNFKQPFENDVTIYMHAVKIEETVPSTEENPDTSDVPIYSLLGILAISGIGLTYVLKKRRFN